MKKLVRLKQFNLSSRNNLLIIGFLFGLILTFFIPENAWDIVQQECPEASTEKIDEKFNSNDFEPHLNLINKPMAAKKAIKNIVRPRYYSSELGIREKLFVGVMTTQDNINTIATAFNRTVAHLVDKIKFFINADNVKADFKLKNIVGFTDTRENLRPFHILKYIADNYLDDFDYFLLVTDTTYVNARRLINQLNHISISFDVYMGHQVENDNNLENDYINNVNDKDNCDLNSGIILSSSVIRKIRANLDWCVRNAATSYHSLNIGKCVKFSSKINGCQHSFQGMNMTNFKLNTYKIYRDLNILINDPQFNVATILYPITTADDFYILNTYFSRLHLEFIKSESIRVEQNAYKISNGTIKNDVLEIRWPIGVASPNNPETRHDVLSWTMLNLTHIIMPDHEQNSMVLTKIDSEDLMKILDRIHVYAAKEYPNLIYINLHTAYRRFDPIRGMDYQIHLNYRDKNTNRKIVKSFEVVKPLGRVEIVTSPYVTESTRIALLLPVFEHQVKEAIEFVNRYEQICMTIQDNTFLMLVFLYRLNSPSKGDEDVFYKLKNIAINLSDKYKNDGSRIAWVSIRLPMEFDEPALRTDIMLSSMYAQNEILSLVMTDLALRKIGLESLVMICSNSMTFKSDFLNRVRMNTIQGFQIFSPIGFMMYPCSLANFCKECDTCDISQGTGYFDTNNYDVIAFYSRDYVEARKALETQVPIIRSDNDISNILKRIDQNVTNIVDMFVKSQITVHILRAIEPNLRFGIAIKNYVNLTKDIPRCQLWNTQNTKKCIHLASRKQIGDALVKYENSVVNKN